MVEFSPATRGARVRFPANASIFCMAHILYFNRNCLKNYITGRSIVFSMMELPMLDLLGYRMHFYKHIWLSVLCKLPVSFSLKEDGLSPRWGQVIMWWCLSVLTIKGSGVGSDLLQTGLMDWTGLYRLLAYCILYLEAARVEHDLTLTDLQLTTTNQST